MEAVREGFPGVELIETGANLGFAGGNNAGISRALERGASHVLVLNNDVEVDPGFVNALARGGGPPPRRGRPVQHDPVRRPARPDLVRGRELRPTLRLQRSPARLPRARRRPLRRGGRDRSRLRRRDARPARRVRSGRPVRRGALPLRGGHRVVAAGARGRLPTVRRLGKQGAPQGLGRARAARARPRRSYYDTRNSIVVCERHAPLAGSAHAARRLVLVGAHLVQALRSTRRRQGLAAVLRGWRDARAGRLGPAPRMAA